MEMLFRPMEVVVGGITATNKAVVTFITFFRALQQHSHTTQRFASIHCVLLPRDLRVISNGWFTVDLYYYFFLSTDINQSLKSLAQQNEEALLFQDASADFDMVTSNILPISSDLPSLLLKALDLFVSNYSFFLSHPLLEILLEACCPPLTIFSVFMFFDVGEFVSSSRRAFTLEPGVSSVF